MIGLIGGTGLGEALLGEAAAADARSYTAQTPFGPPSAPIRVTRWDGVELAILSRHGEGHTFNPSQVPYRANIIALRQLGVTRILASGAVGSLREHIHPRELVVVDQLIDRTSRRPSTFFDEGLAVHVEFAEPFCPALRQVLLSSASSVNTHVHSHGTYVCMEGPAFSTVGESNLHRAWGGDVIGMTALPEAKLAREAEMCYSLIALPTDYDCWRPHEPGRSRQALLEEIVSNLKAATANAVSLIRAAVETLAKSPPAACPCRSALELAIWSDRARVSPTAVRRLSPLLDRYFREP